MEVFDKISAENYISESQPVIDAIKAKHYSIKRYRNPKSTKWNGNRYTILIDGTEYNLTTSNPFASTVPEANQLLNVADPSCNTMEWYGYKVFRDIDKDGNMTESLGYVRELHVYSDLNSEFRPDINYKDAMPDLLKYDFIDDYNLSVEKEYPESLLLVNPITISGLSFSALMSKLEYDNLLKAGLIMTPILSQDEILSYLPFEWEVTKEIISNDGKLTKSIVNKILNYSK
jgi:hypothetical protein